MGERIMMQMAGSRRALTFNRKVPGPLLSSAATDWAGLPFEVHQMQPVEDVGEAGPLDGECGLLVILDGQVDILSRHGTRDLRLAGLPGSVSFVSGDERRNIVRITGSARAAALHLAPEWRRRLLLEDAPLRFSRARPLVRDETVRTLSRAMCEEVARGVPTGRLYGESLSLALLTYLLERMHPTLPLPKGGLSEAQVNRLRHYILDRLHENLSITEFATLVGLRPRHFATTFQRTFGATPHRYVLRQRLEEGARLLASGHHEIAEIAFRVGFCNQSHFTVAFRRAFGVTPRRYCSEKRTITAVL